MNDGKIGLGVIGCGGFGLFALQNFVQVPGVKLMAMAGTAREQALTAAKRFGLPDVGEVDDLLADPDVDLVYIATPPFLHHPQAMAALTAGKHVIVEKPMALTVAHADEMIAAARERDLLMTTNLMQRYNPMYDSISGVIDTGALGDVLHGSFENYASDEGLFAEHWFWDREKSGGILVEHAVHFFDLFAGWLGPGQVRAARVGARDVTGLEEQAGCTVLYPSGIWVDFYHGFHQAQRMDRQVLKLAFEQGEIEAWDWIPTRLRLHAIVDEEQTRTLTELFPKSSLDASVMYAGQDRHYRNRGVEHEAYQMIEMLQGFEDRKYLRYGRLLRAMLADQLAWIHDRNHQRRITEVNGRDSLAMAEQADELAHETAQASPVPE
ncbi:MAG: dehydrogenase [Catenulispora sp. 13_1_20CM_3_70_7]|jgi:predicted dehydrogenase|nr:Gfo/Idh/MocA family oxidoreductase [Catenulisporales bacterium]OLE24747.1 MAG: dehydrogenase [Catenulispora sp. 13_1_20CM_3_70_7]